MRLNAWVLMLLLAGSSVAVADDRKVDDIEARSCAWPGNELVPKWYLAVEHLLALRSGFCLTY